MKKLVIFIGILFVFLSNACANDTTGVELHFAKERLNDSSVLLTIKAIVPGDAKLYALLSSKNNVLYSTVDFDSAFKKKLIGDINEKGLLHTENEATVNASVNYYSDSVL